MISCPNIAPETSSTTRTQTADPFGWGRDDEGENPVRGDGEAPANVGQRRCARAVACDDL